MQYRYLSIHVIIIIYKQNYTTSLNRYLCNNLDISKRYSNTTILVKCTIQYSRVHFRSPSINSGNINV